MKSILVKRLFKALSEGSDQNIEDSRKSNRVKFADDLERILNEKNDQKVLSFKTLNKKPSLEAKNKELSSFASIIPRESLEHYMVLEPEVENRFLKIEKEYAARDRLSSYGLKPRKKILLYGPPGCGKTLGARRLAWTTGLDLVKVKFDAMVSSLFGESASNLRYIFEYCQENPSVLLLDECDFIARSRENKKDIGEVHRIVNTLLQLLEDYDPPGLVVATTNLYDQLDHALFRRFDDVLFVPKPSINEAVELLKDSTQGLRVQKRFPWKKVAEKVENLSAANIVNIAHNACKDSILKGQNSLSLETLEGAIEEFHKLV